MKRITNHAQARADVLRAAREGRAMYLPAGARDNAVALVLIDGEVIGQASELMHYVRQDLGGRRFGLQPLVEGYPHQIPTHLASRNAV